MHLVFHKDFKSTKIKMFEVLEHYPEIVFPNKHDMGSFTAYSIQLLKTTLDVYILS